MIDEKREKLFERAKQRIITKCKKTHDIYDIDNILYDLEYFKNEINEANNSTADSNWLWHAFYLIDNLEDDCIRCLQKKFDKFKPVYQEGKTDDDVQSNYDNIDTLGGYLELAKYLTSKQNVQLVKYLDTFLSSKSDEYTLTRYYKLALEINKTNFHKFNRGE